MLRLKEIRESRHITQRQLAKALQVSHTTISNWEAGVRQPDLDSIVHIADYFDISLDFLLGRNFKNRLYNQDNYVFNRDQLMPIFHKILGVDERYFPNLDGFIDALLAKSKSRL